jgi:hypothetical protein
LVWQYAQQIVVNYAEMLNKNNQSLGQETINPVTERLAQWKIG